MSLQRINYIWTVDDQIFNQFITRSFKKYTLNNLPNIPNFELEPVWLNRDPFSNTHSKDQLLVLLTPKIELSNPENFCPNSISFEIVISADISQIEELLDILISINIGVDAIRTQNNWKLTLRTNNYVKTIQHLIIFQYVIQRFFHNKTQSPFIDIKMPSTVDKHIGHILDYYSDELQHEKLLFQFIPNLFYHEHHWQSIMTGVKSFGRTGLKSHFKSLFYINDRWIYQYHRQRSRSFHSLTRFFDNRFIKIRKHDKDNTMCDFSKGYHGDIIMPGIFDDTEQVVNIVSNPLSDGCKSINEIKNESGFEKGSEASSSVTSGGESNDVSMVASHELVQKGKTAKYKKRKKAVVKTNRHKKMRTQKKNLDKVQNLATSMPSTNS